MSSLIVEVCRIDKITPHSRADRLEIAEIKGWQTVVAKDKFKEGDKVVFFPPDSILPSKLSDRIGVTNYLKQLSKNEDGIRPDGGRVAVANLRSQPSYGLIIPVDDSTWEVGKNVAEFYGVTKWEPPLDCLDGDAEKPHNAFHKYYDMENYRNFPDLIKEGEPVVICEKIHGKNAKVGLIREQDETGKMKMTWMAGSHNVRRKEFVTKKRIKEDGTVEEWKERSQFWEVLYRPGIKPLLEHIAGGKNDVIVFGEIYGSGVQDMTYGFERGNWGFRVFDISVNGTYMNVSSKIEVCNKFGIEMVPVLYDGPFSKEKVSEFVSGLTTVCPSDKAGKFKEREGIVITTKEECSGECNVKVFGRKVLKAINFAYLERKGGTEFH